MDGVTILQTIPAHGDDFLKALSIALAIGFVIIMFGVYASYKCIWAIILTGCLAIVFTLDAVSIHHKQYKITVSDTVSYNKLTAKYNIIETDGKIITVEEKDNGKNSD